MKKTLSLFVALGIATGAVTSCSKSNSSAFTPPVVAPVDTPYTSQSVLTAYDNFNRFLLDTTNHLYYKNTGKTGFGAIWTQATYWDMAMNAYKLTKDDKYKQLIENIYQGGVKQYDNYNWDNGKVWFIYDDIMWWVISLARAYEVTGDAKYLAHSEAGFERVWSGSKVVGDDGSYDEANSGMFWQWDQGNPSAPRTDNGKMSCINYPTVVAAMTLYNATKNEDYLNKAKEIYSWAHNNLFNASNGKVADSRHGTSNDWTVHTYNQATCIGAAVMLYNQTKDQAYLNDAVLAADFTEHYMSDANGILPYEGGEEQGVYNAILAQYMNRLILDGNKPQYLPWLRRNIQQAWSMRERSTNLTTKNYYANPAFDLSVYDASSIPALMLIAPPAGK